MPATVGHHVPDPSFLVQHDEIGVTAHGDPALSLQPEHPRGVDGKGRQDLPEIQSPSEFTSGIIADLNARRAEVSGVEVQGPLRLVSGCVPLAHMFGYATAVRSLSQGRASFSMQPAGFRVVPPEELAARGLTWS